jgi:hypothetical protein
MVREVIPPVDPEGVGPVRPPEQRPKATPDRSQFESIMNEPTSKPPSAGTPSASQISPLDLPQGSIKGAAQPSFETLAAQVWESENTYNELRKNLQNKNLKLKRSEQYLMRNKLSDANTHLKGASEKIGAKVLDSSASLKGSNPVEKFLNMVSDGQNQLQEAKETLINLKDSEGNLKPGDMMLIQVKLAQAQQELEYASILLSKVVDVIKQMINIQL